MSAILKGEVKRLNFYEWPNDSFLYDLRSDLGERNNLAKARPAVAAAMHQNMKGRLKAVGGCFPKPNPNADPKAKRYDPSNLADQGPGGDPEESDETGKAAAKSTQVNPKKKKAKR